MRNLMIDGGCGFSNSRVESSVISAGLKGNSTLKIPAIPQSTAGNAGFKIGVIEAKRGNVRKRIIDVAGKPQKDPNHSLSVSRGIFSNRDVNGLYGLADLLSEIDGTDQALTLGTIQNDGFYGVVSADDLEKPVYANYQQTNYPPGHLFEPNNRIQGYISRTADFVKQPAGTYALVLDHDAEPGKEELTTQQFWDGLCELVPALRTVGRLVTPSSSAAIYDKATGELLKPETSHHTYILCKGDMSRLVDLFKVMGWLKGTSFFKLGQPNKAKGTCAVLPRHILDLSVFSFERLVYEAGATFEPGSRFFQKRSLPVVHDGVVLDCDSLPVPTAEQRATAEALMKSARDAIAPARKKAAVKHCRDVEGLTEAEAEATATRRLSQCDRGVLDADHILYGMNGQTYTAGELTKADDGLLLRDPQEPDYRGGAQVARLFWGDKGNGWTIVSQAHGGTKYRLATEKTEAAAEKRAAKKTTLRALADQWETRSNFVPVDGEYIGTAIDDAIAAGHDLIVVDAPCGSGKTTAIKHVRKRADDEGRQILAFTETTTDARSKGRADELSLPYRDTLEGLQAGEYPNLIACHASMRPDARHVSWESNVSSSGFAVFDEAHANHAAIAKGYSGGQKRRDETYSSICKKAAVVVGMSATLQNHDAELLETLSQCRNPIVLGIAKTYRPRNIFIYNDSVGEDGKICDDGSIAAQFELKRVIDAGKNALIMTDAQKGWSTFGTEKFEKVLTSWGVNPSDILRVDSLTTADPTHPALNFGIGNYIELMRRFKYVICSPSVLSGFNFDFGDRPHFSAVFSFDGGSTSLSSNIQKFLRERSQCDVHVVIREINAPTQEQQLYTPQDVLEFKQAQAKAHNLQDWIAGYSDACHFPSWENPFDRYYCQRVASENCANADRAYNLARYCADVGHIPRTPAVDYEAIKPFRHQLRALKDSIDKLYTVERATAGTIGLDDAKRIKDAPTKSRKESLITQNTDMLNQLDLIPKSQLTEDGSVEKIENAVSPVELTPGLTWQLGKERLGTYWKLHYIASEGEALWESIDDKEISSRRNSNRDRTTRLLAAADLGKLTRTKLGALNDYGLIEFFKRVLIEEVDDTKATELIAKLTRELWLESPVNKSTLSAWVQDICPPDKTFSSADAELSAIVARLNEGTNFEDLCLCLNVKSVRNKAGQVTKTQVLTILAQFFKFSRYSSKRGKGGQKGLTALLSDDRLAAVIKRYRKFAAMRFSDRAQGQADEAKLLETFNDFSNRKELHPTWDKSYESLSGKKGGTTIPITKNISNRNSGTPSINADSDAVDADVLQVAAGVADVIEADKNTSPAPATTPTATTTGDKEVSQLVLVDRGNELAQTVSFKVSQRVPHPITPADVIGLFVTWVDNGGAVDLFQNDLCIAQSLADLERAKRNTPEDVRRAAMALWEADDRYELLKSKVARLRAEEGALVAA